MKDLPGNAEVALGEVLEDCQAYFSHVTVLCYDARGTSWKE